VVPTRGRDEVDVVENLANALARLEADEDERLRMGRAAIAHAGTMRWEDRVQGVLALVEQARRGNGATWT
jgi:hypothetical protein